MPALLIRFTWKFGTVKPYWSSASFFSWSSVMTLTVEGVPEVPVSPGAVAGLSSVALIDWGNVNPRSVFLFRSICRSSTSMTISAFSLSFWSMMFCAIVTLSAVSRIVIAFSCLLIETWTVPSSARIAFAVSVTSPLER